MAKSKFGKFNWRDMLHAFIVTFVTSSLTGIIDLLNSNQLPNLAMIETHAVIGLTAGLSYVLKIVLENSKGELLKKEPTE